MSTILLLKGIINNRVQCVQQKTGTNVHYEITPRTQQSLSLWIHSAALNAQCFLFPSCRRKNQAISYSFYRAIIRRWAIKLGLNADYYGTHSMRRTKATLIYARTKNIRAVQISAFFKLVVTIDRFTRPVFLPV